MPAHITSNTGLDALTHCVEAYVSNIEDNYADVLAKGGLEIVFQNLEEAVNNPGNIKARQNMHDASFMGGLALIMHGWVLYTHYRIKLGPLWYSSWRSQRDIPSKCDPLQSDSNKQIP
jgi:alcohol dehydrogenase class IV